MVVRRLQTSTRHVAGEGETYRGNGGQWLTPICYPWFEVFATVIGIVDAVADVVDVAVAGHF
jgi:hypothetical protein